MEQVVAQEFSGANETPCCVAFIVVLEMQSFISQILFDNLLTSGTLVWARNILLNKKNVVSDLTHLTFESFFTVNSLSLARV